MTPYLNLIAGILCTVMGLIEFARLKNTRQWNLFWNAFLAGLNLYFAAKGFGWL